MMLPPETFRVRSSRRSRLYFVVHVAPTPAAMRVVMRRHAGGCHPRQLACVMGASSKMMPGLVGLIFFTQSCLGVGIVAHEMAHAAFRYCERRGLRVTYWQKSHSRHVGQSEEVFCAIVEHLNRDFWNRAYRAGICKPT